MLLPAFDRAAQSGARITIRTRPEEDAIVLLEQWEITVETQEELWQRYAVIDEMIVWYGDIDYLSYSSKETNALRFESADVAYELLERQLPGRALEQLRIDETSINDPGH